MRSRSSFPRFPSGRSPVDVIAVELDDALRLKRRDGFRDVRDAELGAQRVLELGDGLRRELAETRDLVVRKLQRRLLRRLRPLRRGGLLCPRLLRRLLGDGTLLGNGLRRLALRLQVIISFVYGGFGEEG